MAPKSPASWHEIASSAKRSYKRIFFITAIFLVASVIFLATVLSDVVRNLFTILTEAESSRLFQVARLCPLMLFVAFGSAVIFLFCILLVCRRMYRNTVKSLSQLADNALSINQQRKVMAGDVGTTDIATLAKSIESMRIMLDAMPIGCFVWDRSHNIIDVNDAGVKFFGFDSREELVARFYECTPDLQPGGMNSSVLSSNHLEDAFANGTTSFQWMHILPKTGEEIETEVTLVRMNYGNEYVVASYMHDVREHQKLVNEIGYREHLLQTINMTTGMLLQAEPDNFETSLYYSLSTMASAADINHIFVWEYVSDDTDQSFFNQIYIYSDSELNSDIEIVERFGREKQRIIYTSDEAKDIEMRLVQGENVSGNVRDLRPSTVKALFLEDSKSYLIVPLFLRGNLWGAIGYCNNERDYYLSETDESVLLSGGLAVASALFRHQITQKLEVTATELDAALKEAQVANSAKSNFLSSMSHEMRTPINAITGMVALGKRSSDLEYKNYAFDRISDASGHLLGVISDVLDMSKIEAGMLTLSAVRFNLYEMLNQVISLLKFRLDEKKQKIYVDVDADVPGYLVADDQRLAQVLTNLLSNAIKFTPEKKEIRVTIKLLEQRATMCTLQFSVSDQGIGLTENQQKFLFEPFAQAEGSTTRKYGGTGLGLTISKHIVELMDGNISLVSSIGEGATFTFTIAAKVSEQQEEFATREEVDLLALKFPGKRLLLVEDVEINREIVVAMLEESMDEIVCAQNGEEAVTIFAQKPNYFDVVLMDIHMPIMDGLDATRAIRQMEHGHDVPIIAMTANVFKEDIKKCIDTGMSAHLGKPLDVKKMFELFQQYLIPKE